MKWSIIIGLFFLSSCDLTGNNTLDADYSIYASNHKINIENAQGFILTENDSNLILKIKSISTKYPFSDSLIFSKSESRSTGKFWQCNWQNIACQSTTHLTFLNELDAFDRVVALGDIAYMPKDHIFSKVHKSNIVELNKNNDVDIEQLVSLKPDVFLMFPFEWDRKKYRQANVKTLLIAEYLEERPIARLEWIKVFGLLIGKENLADSLFLATKSRYQAIKQSQSTGKTVFFNLPYKDQWDMPAPKSITVNLVKDAGFTYVFDKRSASIDNILMSKEEVWSLVHEVDYWIIVASRPKEFSLKDLIAEEAVYKTFKSVKQGQVIFCNTAESSYFTQGILEPDIMLEDLLHLTQQSNDSADYQPKYFHILR